MQSRIIFSQRVWNLRFDEEAYGWLRERLVADLLEWGRGVIA